MYRLIVWKEIFFLRRVTGVIWSARSTSRNFEWENRYYLAILRDFFHGYLPTAADMAFSLSRVCIVHGRPVFASAVGDTDSRRRFCNRLQYSSCVSVCILRSFDHNCALRCTVSSVPLTTRFIVVAVTTLGVPPPLLVKYISKSNCLMTYDV
jgi:hypothetical protein